MGKTNFGNVVLEESGDDLKAQLDRVVADLTAIRDLVNDRKAKYNAHTHVENTAGAYTQNAITAAPAAGQQTSVADVTVTTL